MTSFWTLGTLSERERVRMLDASLVAEMYGLLINGVTDGGQPKISALYERFKDSDYFKSENICVCDLRLYAVSSY